MPANMQHPDLETKIALLQEMTERELVIMPNDVLQFIASNTRTVRELEGAVIRLIAFHSLTGAEINLSTARAVLKNIIGQQSRKIMIESIQ